MSNPVRFLSRWSRLKRQAVVEPADMPVPASPAASATGAMLPAIDSDKPVGQIGPDTDLTALLREELSDAVRKQALKAIFADPHFNVMDGLDTYIDDYSISDPISPEMLATLNQARFLFEADETKPEDAPVLAVSQEHDAGNSENCDNLDHDGQKVSIVTQAEVSEREK